MGCKPKDIVAVIGPSIGVCCLEVGADVEDLFHDNLLLRQCIEVVKGKEKRHINLQNAVRLQLEEAGILHGNIDDFPSTFCTFCNEDRFFSYRRMVGHLALKLALLQYVNTIITSSQQHLLEKLGGQKSTVECRIEFQRLTINCKIDNHL